MSALSYPTRARVSIRIALTRLLQLVPSPWVRRVRDRYATSTRLQRRLLAALITVLRHRPLAPLTEFTLAGGPARRFAAVESRLTRLIYWYGRAGHEPHEVAWWERLCAGATSIVEVGANIGYFTVHGAYAAPAAEYLAVEAHPESADILRQNLSLNSLDHVKVVNAAVVGDDSAGTVTLGLPDQERYLAPTGAYLLSGAEGIANRPSSHDVTVTAMPARGLFPPDVDLIKLDIEGHEAHVLESARELIIANRPIIVVEVLKHVPHLRRILCELYDQGYIAFAYGEPALHLITGSQLRSSDPLPRYGSRDVVLVPAERAGEL